MSVVSSTALRTGLALAALQPCCLCDNPRTAASAMFVPSERFGRLIGAPAGKHRVVFYSLCASCLDRGDKTELIETGLLRLARRRDAA
jgi:hypothetical protein